MLAAVQATGTVGEGLQFFLLLINSGILVATLVGIGHTLLKVGSISTKIETMWEWYLRQRGDNGHD